MKIENIDRFINNKINSEKVIKGLTDDASFMKEVIKNTKDKRFYSLSSERLKSNYDFVLFITEEFREDINFVFDVINYYVNKNNGFNYEYLKLMSVANRLLQENEDEVHYTNYMRFVCRFLYAMDKIKVNINCHLYNASEDEKNQSGLGFKYIKDKYEDDDIRFFVAKYMISKIFRYDFFNDYIHTIFKLKEEIDSSNIDKYLIKYINIFDKELGEYAYNNIKLLNNIKSDIERMKSYYDRYNVKEVDKLVVEFENKLKKFLEFNDIYYNDEVKKIKKEAIIKHNLEKEFNLLLDEKTNDNIKLSSNELQKVKEFINIELYNIFYLKNKSLSLKNVDTKNEKC